MINFIDTDSDGFSDYIEDFTRTDKTNPDSFPFSVVIKNTRIVIRSLEDTGQITGLFTNYANDFSDIMIELQIISDGVVPNNPTGGGDLIQVYPSLVKYKLQILTSGDTIEWNVPFKITDNKLDKIEFQLRIFMKDKNTGNYIKIYAGEKESIDLEISSQLDSPQVDKEEISSLYCLIGFVLMTSLCVIIYIILKKKR